MNECLQTAMSNTKFGIDGAKIPRLFMVNEAEAAAMHVLAAGTTKLRVCSNRVASMILLTK